MGIGSKMWGVFCFDPLKLNGNIGIKLITFLYFYSHEGYELTKFNIDHTTFVFQVTLPFGSLTEFSIIDGQGVERLLRTENGLNDISW